MEKTGPGHLRAATCSRRLRLRLCPQQVRGQASDVLPGQVHVAGFHHARADGEAQQELVSEATRNQVDFFGGVYLFQEGFVQLVGTLEGSRERGHASANAAP